MKYVDLTLRLPDWMLHPMQEFIRSEDAVRYEEMLTWSVRPDEGVQYLLLYVEADPEPYADAIEEVETIIECRIAPIDGASAHVWVREELRPEEQALLAAFENRQLLVVPPLRFDEEAAMGMTLVGPGEDVQHALDDLPPEIDVTVEEIGTYDRRGGTLAGALTDRQLAAVRTALDAGYYEVPREATLEAVADAMDCATSTASTLLRRAERDVLSRVLARYGGTVGRDRSTAADRGVAGESTAAE